MIPEMRIRIAIQYKQAIYSSNSNVCICVDMDCYYMMRRLRQWTIN